jgi:dTDP-4-dehydrorhamnose 3,5-epimerase
MLRQMSVKPAAESIEGVRLVNLREHAEARGSFTELFRAEWFPQADWTNTQCNRSVSVRGVVRGLHFHRQQVDFWHCIDGRVKVGLYDLRRSSPSCGVGQTFDLRAEEPTGLYIPEGVAHGYLALTDMTIFYVVNRYYNPNDEFGVTWNDPELGLNWGSGEVDLADVLVSERDASNPRLDELTDRPE